MESSAGCFASFCLLNDTRVVYGPRGGAQRAPATEVLTAMHNKRIDDPLLPYPVLTVAWDLEK